MRKVIVLLLALQTTLPFTGFGSFIADSSKPALKINLYTLDGNRIKGLLLETSTTNVSLYPGTYSNWKNGKDFKPVVTPVENIGQIHLKKRKGVLKGALIGAGIGLTPFLLSAAFGHGEGGAYISIAAVPVGLLVGSIIGATSKRKYNISADRNSLARLNARLD